MLVRPRLYDLIAKQKASSVVDASRESLLANAARHWMLWIQLREPQCYWITVNLINQLEADAHGY